MGQRGNQSKRESRAIWALRYQQWQSSGLSKASYCKQHDINTTNFYFWCGVFRKDPPRPSDPCDDAFADDKPAFVPITIRDASPLLTLQCGDVTLSCSAAIAVEQLTQWIKALRRAVC